MLLAIIYSTVAGAMIPLGGLLASRSHILPNWHAKDFRHGIIAFGGGALMAAVAFVLVPDGAEKVPVWVALLAFAAGGAFFAWLDWRIAQSGGDKSQLVAMLSDFIPEAIALGALMAGTGGSGLLMALLIGLQNLPEGFNAFREMDRNGTHDTPHTLKVFCALALLGPMAAILGHVVLSGFEGVLGTIMLFAGGGILYLVFTDIAPQAKLENDWYPPLGAVAGFLLGMAGHLVLN